MTNLQHKLTALVLEDMAGERIDKVLSLLFTDYSRTQLNRWLKQGQVLVDGMQPKSKDKVKGGETIVLDVIVENRNPSHQPQAIALDIVYEDDFILIINKPRGLVVHPGAGNPDNTLLNALLSHDSTLNELPRAGIVHRIDKDTTGLLVIAKQQKSYHYLVEIMQERQIKRHYKALVNGVIIAGRTIETEFGRDKLHRTKMAVVENGKIAITHFLVSEKFQNHTLVDVELDTGRTHQIRVHMAHINHTIVGDKLYGKHNYLPKDAEDALIKALQSFNKQALHAAKLSLPHPETGEIMTFEAPLPDDFNQLLALLREHHESRSRY